MICTLNSFGGGYEGAGRGFLVQMTLTHKNLRCQYNFSVTDLLFGSGDYMHLIVQLVAIMLIL